MYLSSLAGTADFTLSRNFGLSMLLANPGPHPYVRERSFPEYDTKITDTTKKHKTVCEQARAADATSPARVVRPY